MGSHQPLTVQAVIDAILLDLKCETLENTVDTIKRGRPNAQVSGIATTLIATRDVLSKAHALSANLVITHEPTYYGHDDDAEWLKGDPVFEAKDAFIKKHDMAIFRLHDYLHLTRPDEIVEGMIKCLGWDACRTSDSDPLFELPQTTLLDLINQLKEKLNIDTVRVVGPKDMTCSKISLRVGAQAGRRHIRDFFECGAEVVICGEAREWEACEYVRDAHYEGRPIALLHIGHCCSEEAGMEFLTERLTKLFPDISSTFIPAGDPFWGR